MQHSRMLGVPWAACSQTEPNLNDDKAWPQLGANNQPKESQTREKNENATIVATSSLPSGQTECRRPGTLEYLEFPELGASVCGIGYDMFSGLHEPEADKVDTATEHGWQRRKSRIPIVFRRHARLHIDLPLIIRDLMSSRSLRHLQTERPKASVHWERSVDATKKIRAHFAKIKKPSKLKRIILLDREMRIHANLGVRHLFTADKNDALSRYINAINIDTLKISSDTEAADMDFTKRMSVLSFTNGNYRNAESEDSSTSASLRRDLVDGLTRLNIRNTECTEETPQDPSAELLRQSITALGHKMNHCVKIDDQQRVVPKIESEDCRFFEHGQEEASAEMRNDAMNVAGEPVRWYWPRFREYCTNALTPSLNENTEKFLSELRRLQRKLYEQNAQKGKRKRRYYCGIKEVHKHVQLKKVKFLIVAPDLEKVQLTDGLDDKVNVLLESCRKLDVVVCFALRRRKLGYHMHGKGFVGCVGVSNYSGLEELFKNVLVELVKAKNDFNKRNGKPEKVVDVDTMIPEDYLLSEIIKNLMRVLTSMD